MECSISKWNLSCKMLFSRIKKKQLQRISIIVPWKSSKTFCQQNWRSDWIKLMTHPRYGSDLVPCVFLLFHQRKLRMHWKRLWALCGCSRLLLLFSKLKLIVRGCGCGKARNGTSLRKCTIGYRKISWQTHGYKRDSSTILSRHITTSGFFSGEFKI